MIYVVDDGSTDGTFDLLQHEFKDEPRIKILKHDYNKGVGAAMKTGYGACRESGLDGIVIKLDADGQMDAHQIPTLIEPILEGRSDYCKGSRFENPRHLKNMPWIRIAGNAGLSLMSKISSGYWSVNDPTNGFTAISSKALSEIEIDLLDDGFFFESDMLFRLRLQRARVHDVPMASKYGDETSHLRPLRQVVPFFLRHLRNFGKRIVYQYFIREWSPGSFLLPSATSLALFSLTFGIQTWRQSLDSGIAATPGTSALVMLTAILSIQLWLSFLQFDLQSEPK